MSIHYSVVYDLNGTEVQIGITDHCFGAMQRMPWDMDNIRYDKLDHLSSEDILIKNFMAITGSEMNKYIKEVRLYDHNQSGHWAGWSDYASHMESVKISGRLGHLTNYQVRDDHIAVPTGGDELWEELMPRLFFVRNMLCYSESLPTFLSYNLGPAIASLCTLYFAPSYYGDAEKVFPDNDCEYGFFNTNYFGEEDFENIYLKGLAIGAGDGTNNTVSQGGYYREETYSEEDIDWGMTDSWGDTVYFALNLIMLTRSEGTFAPFDMHGEDKVQASSVAMRTLNYLTIKGIDNA